MKLAALLVFTVAVTVVSGASLEKRGIIDFFRNVTSNVVDKVRTGWNNLRQRVADYDIKGRFNELKDKVKAKYGDIAARLGNTKFENIAEAAKDVIEDEPDVPALDDFVGKVRKSLGDEADDVTDEEIEQIADVVEEDIASDDSDADSGLRKRGLQDDLKGSFKDLTVTGKQRFSDVYDLASKGWRGMKKKIGLYDVANRLPTLRKKTKSRFGGKTGNLSDSRFRKIAQSAKDVIVGSDDVLGRSDIRKKIRSRTGADLADVPDEDIDDIVDVVEDDASNV